MKQQLSKILVTGGAGFIGSHIVDKLLNKDFEVTLIDNFSTGRFENISHHQNTETFHLIKGEILDLDFIKSIMKDQDVIFHQAAITNVPFSYEHPILTNDVNIKGTINLLKSCLDFDVKKFVFASSASVYGKKDFLPKREDMSLNPKSPYAISKLAAENYINLFYDLYGLKTTILRYFNVYGPRARKNQGVISIFINQVLNNQSPIVHGDGEQSRDFINVNDVADANLLVLSSNNAVGESINIGTGLATSLNKILDILLNITHKKHIKPVYTNPRLGDVKHGYASIKKAQDLLGFNPKISLKEGISQLVNWYKKKIFRC